MNEPVKPIWYSGQDIVNERGKTIYELFDLMKKGLQAYTNTHEKIVDCDFLLKPRRKLLEYITAEVGREFASLTGPPFSKDEINLTAKQRYNIWTGGILDHQIGCELMSFDEMVKNSLSEVWDFQFKTADVDKFFDNEYSQSHPLLSYEETQNEMERKAWDIISDLTGIGPEEMQNAINKYYQSIMVNNRAIIRAGSEESQNGTADPLLSIIVNNRSIIADLAGSKGTESERELKASYLISTLAGSEEIQNETADLQKQERTIEEKINLEYLRDTAHEWIKDHPVIKSIYLVTANRTDGKEVHAHYRYTLIAIVPTPDDDYRNWAGDGFHYNFPEDDVRDCGLVDFSWVTFASLDEAREYVDENIKDNLQKGARVKWDDLTGDVESQKASQGLAPQEIEPQKQPPQTANEIKNYDAFIRSLQVSCVRDTEISIKVGDSDAKNYTCVEMGFKSSENGWKLLMEVLEDRDHLFDAGTYSKDKIPEKNKRYNQRQKWIPQFTKKFINFLNKRYNARIPDNTKLLENQKNKNRDGLYKPIFQVAFNGAIHCTDIKNMSKEETINKLKNLHKQLKGEKNSFKKDSLLKEIGDYAEHAKKNEWITWKQLQNLISPPDEDASAEDAMSLTEQHKKTVIISKNPSPEPFSSK